MSTQTPQTDAIRTMLHKKYAGNFTGSRKLLYYMEAAECYGQECAALEADRDRLRALCEELTDLWRQEKALQENPQPGLFTWMEAKNTLHFKVEAALAKAEKEPLG